jgi:predicted PurR-regulated permease PerM
MKRLYRVTVDTKTFIRFWLVILGFGAAGLLIWKASLGLLIVGAALFLALAISPLVRKLSRLIPGKGNKLPIAIAYTIVIACIIAFIMVVVPTIVNESVRFAKNFPTTIDHVTQNLSWINDAGEQIGIHNLQDQLVSGVSGFAASVTENLGANIINSLGTLATVISAVILILVLTLFMLTEGPSLSAMFWGNFKNNKQANRAERVIGRMANVISKYVSNALTVAMINAAATAVVVFILCLIFRLSPGLALPFGLITGVFSLIPMFGSFIGGALVALLLAFNVWGAGLAFIIYTIVYLQLEANVISPKIQGKGLQLPALAVLAAVTIGVYMFGIIGAIISIPIAGCIKVLIEEYGKWTVADDEKKPEVHKAETKKAEDKKLIANQS